jgi:flagellar protein FliJ
MGKKPKKSKRFIYNLAAVLKVRIIKETLQKEEVTKAEKKYQEELEKEAVIAKAMQAEHNAILSMYNSGEAINLRKVELHKFHLETLEKKLIEQKKITLEAERRIEEEKKKLLKAVRDKKILEKDKEKKRAIWKKIMGKEEMKFLDDIASSRFSKSNDGDEE